MNKKIEEIIRKFKIEPSKLLFIDDVSNEEMEKWFEDTKEDLINFMHSSLKYSDERKK